MWWLFVLLLVPGVQAAELSGSLYGPDLDPVDEAVITVNTTPEQVFVITNATYHLSLPAGSYLIAVEANGLYDEQNVSIAENGSYVRDLILLPLFELPSFPEAPSVGTRFPSEDPGRRAWWLPIVLTIIVLIVVGAWFVKKRKGRIEHDTFAQAVIEALIKHDGRATQKQIRAEVPFSEAKVSLVIADLAEQGFVRKFKRGRGNIVVLEDGPIKKPNETQDAKRDAAEDPFEGSAQATADRGEDHSVAVQDADESDQQDPSGEQNERETRRP